MKSITPAEMLANLPPALANSVVEVLTRIMAGEPIEDSIARVLEEYAHARATDALLTKVMG